MDINITPAVQIEEKKNLSAEEFQKQLCSWLESRGLLCELRAYFRSNMIEVLKNTALGSSISCKVKQPISPKMQAMNLLISEYFFYSQYHFSLCVFCTEVSLNNMLPSINNTLTQVNNQGAIFKFTEKEVYDILEAVGILRYNRQAQKIYTLYSQLDEPLISYFLPSNSLTSIISNEPIECFNNYDVHYDIIGNIDKLMANSNMPPNEVSQMKFYIKQICKKYEEKQTNIINNLKEQYKSQLKKYKSKLHDIQKIFESERTKFEEEINIMKQELNDVLAQNHLVKKSQELISVPKISVHEQLQCTDVAIEQTNTIGQVNLEDKCTQWVEEKPKKILKLNKEQQTITNTSLETAVLKHVVQQLEKENKDLRSDNHNYCEQIDELANRATILMNELSISQQNVVRLNNLLQNSSTTFTNENISHNYQTFHSTGAGEECLHAFKHASQSCYRNLNKPRKSATKNLLPSLQNSSGSSSPTDDLLLEAKRKLKSLELESDDIDHKIRSFTQRYNFTSRFSQNKNTQNTEKPFKFSNELHDFNGDKVFKFGSSSVQKKNSHINIDGASRGSDISFASAATSYSQINLSQSSEED